MAASESEDDAVNAGRRFETQGAEESGAAVSVSRCARHRVVPVRELRECVSRAALATMRQTRYSDAEQVRCARQSGQWWLFWGHATHVRAL